MKKDLTPEEAAKKEAADKKIEELKEIYVIRNFSTTSESFKFMKKIAKTISQVENLEDMQDQDILKLFDVFDEKVIKYVVDSFVLKISGEKRVKLDYEKEFIGEFETLMMVFMMAIQHLMSKVNGEGKSKAQPVEQAKKISSKKR